MIEKLLLVGQSRDNRSPNHFEYSGRRVEASETERRTELARRVSEISLRGRTAYRDGRVVVLVRRRDFLLEITLKDRDDLNRPLGILCSGRLERRGICRRRVARLWARRIAREVGRFAVSIDREFDAELQTQVERAVDRIRRRGCALPVAAVLTL